jgi:hypothetical protein
LRVLFLEFISLEFRGFRFDFVVEKLDKFPFGVRGRVLDVVETEYAEQLRDGESGGIEAWAEVFAESNDLSGSHSRHLEGEGV